MRIKYKNSKLSKPWLSSIWAIDGTLFDATTPGQSRHGSDDSGVELCIPKTPASLEPDHQIV